MLVLLLALTSAFAARVDAAKASQLNDEAVRAMNAGDLDTAERTLEKALKWAGDTSAAAIVHSNLCHVAVMRGHDDAGIEECRLAIEGFERTAPGVRGEIQTYDALIAVYLGHGRPGDARSALEDELALLGDGPSAEIDLRRTLSQVLGGDVTGAVTGMPDLVAYDPPAEQLVSYATTLSAIGNALASRGQPDAAAAAFRRTIDLFRAGKAAPGQIAGAEIQLAGVLVAHGGGEEGGRVAQDALDLLLPLYGPDNAIVALADLMVATAAVQAPGTDAAAMLKRVEDDQDVLEHAYGSDGVVVMSALIVRSYYEVVTGDRTGAVRDATRAREIAAAHPDQPNLIESADRMLAALDAVPAGADDLRSAMLEGSRRVQGGDAQGAVAVLAPWWSRRSKLAGDEQLPGLAREYCAALVLTSRYPEAVPVCDEALGTHDDPSQRDGMLALGGEVHFQVGDYTGAEARWREGAASKDPGTASVCGAGLATALLGEGRPEESVKVARGVVTAASADPARATSDAGGSLLRWGMRGFGEHPADVGAVLVDAAAAWTDPEQAELRAQLEGWGGLALVSNRPDDPDGGMPHAEAAVATLRGTSPDAPMTIFLEAGLGGAYADRKDWVRAVPLLVEVAPRVEKLTPGHAATTWQALGTGYLAEGDAKDAVPALETALGQMAGLPSGDATLVATATSLRDAYDGVGRSDDARSIEQKYGVAAK